MSYRLRLTSHGRAVAGASLVAALILGVCSAVPAAAAAAGGAKARPGSGGTAVMTAPATGDDRGTTSLRQTRRGTQLVWTSPTDLAYADARPEFRVGDRVLGAATVAADRRTLTLTVDRSARIDLADVEVWLGGRRLDLTGTPFKAGTTGAVSARAPGVVRSLQVDPGRRGALATTTIDYKTTKLPWSEFPRPMEVWGHAVLPNGVDDAPLVVFLHGRHSPCYAADQPTSDPVCPGPQAPIPSYLGYDYLQQMLASQGYATVSVSANVINAEDYQSPDGGAAARSALVRHHLERLAAWSSDPTNDNWFGTLDLDQVVTVGHSRGGEGTNMAASDTTSAAPYQIVGQVLIAPTDFGWQTAAYTPTSVFLPTCDGDVYDLQGQRYVDAAQTLAPADRSLRSSLLMRGANHNYFNTEWTPGSSAAPSFDDWGDTNNELCGRAAPQRLTAAEQRRVARTYVGASVDAFIDGTQTSVNVIDAVGATAVPAAGDAVVWTHAIGGNRTTVRPRAGGTVTGAGTACASVYGGPAVVDGQAIAPCGIAFGYDRQVHWSPISSFFGGTSNAIVARLGAIRQFAVGWQAPGTSGGLALDDTLDADGLRDRVDLRVIVDPRRGPARFVVRLGDGTRTWESAVQTLRPFAGGESLAPLWAQTVRVDPDGRRIDTGAITTVELVGRSDQGQVWVLDASARRPGLAAVPDQRLPSIRLGRLTVREGDGPGPGTAELPFAVVGDVTAPARFGVSIAQSTFEGEQEPLFRSISVPPGTTSGVIEVPFEQDSLDETYVQIQEVVAAPLAGVTVGRFGSEVRIKDDDPAPELRFSVDRRIVPTGGRMVFRVTLSAPRDEARIWSVRPVIKPGTRQIRTTDIPLSWRSSHFTDPTRDEILSRALRRNFVTFYIPEGKKTGVVSVPTIKRRAPLPKLMTLRIATGKEATVRLR